MPQIQHVTITVPDGRFQEVESFYVLLGGIPLKRPPALEADTAGAWIGFGATQVHLIGGDPVPPPAHFAIDVGADYDEVVERLTSSKASMRTARDLWGARRTFAEDPVGNLIEMFDSAPPSTPL